MAVLTAPVVKDTGWSQHWVYGSLSPGILISGLLAPTVGRGIAKIGGRMFLASSGLIIASGLVLLALFNIFLVLILLIQVRKAQELTETSAVTTEPD
jgi:hypothetical protein